MSSYSPSLRIELIDTGSQVGTWGQTTNQNLGTLLEAGVCGYTSVSVTSADQALTALNGAPDQSRNMSIALTTTTSAAFNVYAPPSPKTYIIYNASAHAATIFNSTVIGNTTAAGTGVTVPAGRTATVWSDGTNFSFQNTTAAPSIVTDILSTVRNALYPVGSIYTNATNNTNPGTLLGFGTWVAFGAGRVMVGFNAADPLFDSAEETGGSKDAIVVTHTHTGTTGNQSANHVHSGSTDVQGSHQHTTDIPFKPNFSGAGPVAMLDGREPISGFQATASSVAGAHAHNFTTAGVSSDHNHSFTTASAGSSGTNANLQPYITVYLWKRTA
jgi:hypothetical protein